MQADQHRVGSQPDRIADHVSAAGEIEHAVCVDGLLDGGGVVGAPISRDAQGLVASPDPSVLTLTHSEVGGGGGMAGSSGAGMELSGTAL